MGVQLRKKQKVSLDKAVRYALIGIGWDAQVQRGKPEYDFDVTLFMTDADEQCQESEDMIFYNQPDGENMCVHHTGDDRTGSDDGDEGDNEQIQVDFDKIPDRIQKLIVVVTLYKAEVRHQRFRDVNRAYIRILSTSEFAANDGNEEVYYDLTKDLGYENGVIAAKIVRNGRGWDFEAVGEEFGGGLAAACARYGIEVDD